LESIYAIILINVMIFFGSYVSSGPVADIIDVFALSPAHVWSQPWTIVTSMFTHFDFTHILFNMWALYFFGSAVLQILGARRFWLVYMVGGICGSLAFILLGKQHSYVIGASGAIFALGGALALLRPHVKVIFFPIPVPMPLWVGILLNFTIITILTIVLHMGIAWQAHLGGLLFGAAAGWFYKRRNLNAYRWN